MNAINQRARLLFQLPSLHIPSRNDQYGFVPIRDLDRDLEIRIPKPSGWFFPGNTYQITRNGRDYGPLYTATQEDVDDPSPDLVFYFKSSDFPAEGDDVVIEFNYISQDPISGSTDPTEYPVPTRFDRRPPGGDPLPPIAFTPQQREGLTDGSFNDDKLDFFISPYYLIEEGDVVELWIGSRPDLNAGRFLSPSFTVTNPGEALPVYINRADLDAEGDGLRYFSYRVTDRAGNVSKYPDFTGLSVAIQPPELKAPLVPAANDGLITYEDAYPSVEVQIPLYAGARQGDTITVIWGGKVQPPYPLTEEDIRNNPMTSIRVPFADALAQGGGNVDVKYEVVRGTQPAIPSPITAVNVDLRSPGGDNPDPNPDEPWHGNMFPPQVNCGNSPVNTIQEDDYGKPAVATIPRLGKDGTPIWVRWDSVQLFWNKSKEGLAPIPIPDGGLFEDLKYDIPFDPVIQSTGSGQFEVYYAITRQLGVGDGRYIPITAISPPQTVTVFAGSGKPGGRDPLLPAEFPERFVPINTIQAAVGRRGTYFRIPLAGVSNIELSKNPKVSYRFIGVQTPSNQFTRPDDVSAEIPQSLIENNDVALEQVHLNQGYIDVPLDYNTTFFICRNGAIVDYSLSNDEGPKQAPQNYVYFALNRVGSGCALP